MQFSYATMLVGAYLTITGTVGLHSPSFYHTYTSICRLERLHRHYNITWNHSLFLFCLHSHDQPSLKLDRCYLRLSQANGFNVWIPWLTIERKFLSNNVPTTCSPLLSAFSPSSTVVPFSSHTSSVTTAEMPMKGATRPLVEFIDAIPDSKLTGFSSSQRKIWSTTEFRLDMQGVSPFAVSL